MFVFLLFQIHHLHLSKHFLILLNRDKKIYIAPELLLVEIENNDIIMLDTMGELAKMFSICHTAYIGGSFSQTGGHNPLEANIWDKPVVSGPTVFNFKDIYKCLTATKAAFIVNTQEELTVKLSQLLTDKEFYAQACEDSAKIFRENSGAIDFALKEITE